MAMTKLLRQYNAHSLAGGSRSVKMSTKFRIIKNWCKLKPGLSHPGVNLFQDDTNDETGRDKSGLK
jgi:hypothetical protein